MGNGPGPSGLCHGVEEGGPAGNHLHSRRRPGTREPGDRWTARTEDSGQIEKHMRDSGRFGDFTGDWLLQAIGNEYRARVAYGALQGESPIAAFLRQRRASVLQEMFRIPLPETAGVKRSGPASAMPGTVTPSEFWDFYKDRCSEHTFSMLELSAEAFLDQVKEEPTAKDGSTCSTGTRVSCPIHRNRPRGFASRER